MNGRLESQYRQQAAVTRMLQCIQLLVIALLLMSIKKDVQKILRNGMCNI